ncbi:phage tail protein [Methylibium sp.]|uniref:phage tail protein n=1 Tax=Methylibium sp. TaxID=2067992 RepID=UPI001802C78B|nr:phage tail protein [Methylibium sp.]MBA3588302.1 phage tail protein [Methylibium sp.]
MSVSLPNGSTIEIGSAVGTVKNITALTNASPAVATSVAHGFTVGDYLIITSGWSRLTDRLVRVLTAPTVDSFTLEGINTTDTGVFPAGSGVGTAQKVTTFTQITQILTTASQGGEQQFLSYQFLEDDSQKEIPTTKTAGGFNFSVADDPSLAGYIALASANDDRVKRALRVNLSNDSKLCYLGYCTLNETPTLTVNELMACEATVRFLNKPTRYAT